MKASWLELLDRVLRPARADLPRCLRERDRHLTARQLLEGERLTALAACVTSIEQARAVVFAANDGVVPARMTELERQWRRLSRPDPDAGLTDLWARLAPAAWTDRQPWGDTDPALRLEALIALAADVTGVQAAEPAIEALQSALTAWCTSIGPRTRWRLSADDSDGTTELLAGPLAAIREALVARGTLSIMLERAERLEREVQEAALARFPERPRLAQGLAHAALVEHLLRAAELTDRPDPVAPLRELWRTGYAVSAVDPSGMAVTVPPL